jgi:pyruvate dehydrogenase E1 component beta subunit
MRKLTFNEAIIEALTHKMRNDDTIFLIGEDLRYGQLTRSLWKEFGNQRVIDTPIAESGFTGAAVGASIAGMKPVVCHGRCDFMLYAYDSIVNQAAKWRFQTGYPSELPMVIRIGTGGHRGSGCHHSQSLESLFMNVPGLDIVIPSSPHDAKGLMNTALESIRPTLFFEHNQLRMVKGNVPKGDYQIPFGVAEIKKEGSDVTIVATGFMVNESLKAANSFDDESVSVEVLDPRTIIPLDREAIIKSVRKTGRLITAEEGCKTGGFSAEVISTVAEKAHTALKAPVVRIANPDAIIPYKTENEIHVLPNEKDIQRAIRSVVTFS